MGKNPILDLPLHHVLRAEIALPLQHVLNLYTVGSFLRAWRSPRNQRSIEQLFDSPGQARHAAQVYAGWLGAGASHATTDLRVACWWRDEPTSGAAA